MDTLQALFDSTASLYERFNVSDIPPEKRRRIFMEEVLELIEASVSDTGYEGDESQICEEAADVIVTVCGLVMAHIIDYDVLKAAIEKVIAKNDAKTGTTHEMVNGKITRRTQQPTAR